MEKCFIFTTLMLIAVVESLVSYKYKRDEEQNIDQYLSLKITNDNNTNLTGPNQCMCTVTSPSTVTTQESSRKNEKRYTLTEFILLALCCLLMGVLLTTFVFFLYVKRRLRLCFSKLINDVQCDSKQQFGPNMQFLTESAVVTKYETNNPNPADSKNENKAVGTHYQWLNCNDQLTYNDADVNKPRSDRQCHQPSFSHLQLTGKDYQIEQIPNLQRNNDDVCEYFPDGDIDGHNYSVLERENMSRESRTWNLQRPETDAEVGDCLMDSTMGTENNDAAHEYFLLERLDNRHNQD